MKKLLKWGIIILIIFILIGIVSGGSSKNGNNALKSGFDAGKKTDQLPKPKVSFNGKITPSTVNKGEKVSIEFEVENIDDKTPIDGVRILFANQNILNKGLIITNVMSGGIQQGRAFEWTNDLMKIQPKEKRNFVIMAVASQPGNYESEVTFVNPTGKTAFDDQGQSLKAKLIVLP